MRDDFKSFYREILQSSVKDCLPKAILERFEVVSCLAFDDKKELYLLKDRRDGKKDLLRVTKGEAAGDASIEAAILSGLNHPAIPKMIGLWNEDDRSFLIREYFDGVTLHARVKGQGVLKADRAMEIAEALCDILSHLHGQKPPVIHRDIKPENIVLTKEGTVKLIDFGIARKFILGASKDTQIIGTEPYMAPEQYGSEQTDGRADLYSLGIVMIFMATGLDGRQFLNGAFPHKELAPIIQKCIQVDRALRYQSAERLKRRILRTRRRTTRTIVLCAAACVGAAAAFGAGHCIGQRQGFDQGVDWLLSTPAITLNSYAEESYEPVTFQSWYVDLAVHNILGKGQEAPVYRSEVRARVGKLQIYGTFVVHPSLNTVLIKTHRGKDWVEHWTDSGFWVSDRGDINDLTDITMFYYLRELELTSQAIFDLSPLSGMKLEKIALCNNFVGNLLPLKDMVTLRELDLCQNPLSNLTPISRLLSLERLDISQTQVSDLRPLSGLTKLLQLEMNYCDAKDLSPISGLTRLQVLGMRGIAAKNYDFLRNMERLVSLDVADCGLRDLEKLPELERLETLRLSGNPIVTLAGIERYAGLTALYLDGTEVMDIDALVALPGLRHLDLSGTGVQDIGALAGLTALAELDISDTFVTDLTPLLRRAEPITVRCVGIPEGVVARVRNAQNIVIAE